MIYVYKSIYINMRWRARVLYILHIKLLCIILYLQCMSQDINRDGSSRGSDGGDVEEL
jgi:hypothetical protein